MEDGDLMKIYVLSNDTLFARMLVIEIEAMRRNYTVILNNYDHSDRDALIILDLDSPYASGSFETANIIGFSKNEKSISPERVEKCRVLLHRPFLIDKFLEHVESLCISDGKELVRSEKRHSERLCFLRDGLITLDERGIHLSENEYALLMRLNDRKGYPVSRDELSSVLSSSDGNICDVYICKLRSKLESGSSERFIYTVRSKGYMLKI